MTNKWLDHVRQFRQEHPELSYKEVLQKARPSYTPVEKKVVVSRPERAEARRVISESKKAEREKKLRRAWDMKQAKDERARVRLEKKAEKEAEKERKMLEREKKLRLAWDLKQAKDERARLRMEKKAEKEAKKRETDRKKKEARQKKMAKELRKAVKERKKRT